jgi:glycerophosphoryl diester phosphodiesterase
MTKIIAAAIVAVTSVLGSPASAFDLQGHRGARGLAPENTLEAFKTALSTGVTTLELDLAMTSDGVLVVSHDGRLNPGHTRGPDGKFLDAEGPAIRSLTLAQLQRYDVGRLKPGTALAAAFPEQRGMDGVRIPTLSEVFDLVRRANAGHIRFNIETKLTPTSGAGTPDPETFATGVVQAVREAELTARVGIQSFDWRTLAIVRRIAPQIERICLSIDGGGDTLQRGQPGAIAMDGGIGRRRFYRFDATAGGRSWLLGLVAQLPQPKCAVACGSKGARAQGHPLDRQRARRYGTRAPDGGCRHYHGLSEPVARGDGGERHPAAAVRFCPLKHRSVDPLAD